MFCHYDSLETRKIVPGLTGAYLGSGEAMNAMHWVFEDNVALPRHSHSAVQFGYIIRGAFRVTIGEEKALLKAGDAYFIPANVAHDFVSVGETEAIDVFSPARDDIPPWRSDDRSA